MVEETHPTTFAELLQLSGLSHGTDVWLGNAQDLIKEGIATLKTVIGCRDDIMVYLMHAGLDPKMAFTIMERVRKGMWLKISEEERNGYIQAMRENNVPAKVVVGGAVLTADYAQQIGADYYAKDARETVEIARKVIGA
mgnify:CR=1 FL=1